MSPHLSRLTALSALLAVLGGCVSEPRIDLSELPPEATIDDGLDYYSASLPDDDILVTGETQWTSDEEGNRVYLLNRAPRGQGSSIYYVGDIRYLAVAAERDGNRPTGTGYYNTPVIVSRNGSPLQSPTLRGSRNNTYYQTRRGRIVYLPSAGTPTSSDNNDSDAAPAAAPASSSRGSQTRTSGSVNRARTSRPSGTQPSTRSSTRSRPSPQRSVPSRDDSLRQDQ